jgi:protein-disulfide isomerase
MHLKTTTRRGAMLAAAAAALLLSSPHARAQAGAAPARPAAAAVAPGSPANLDSLLERANRSRTRGAETARITLIEISDFQCPYCRQFFDSTYTKLDSAYIRSGRVKMMFMAYPIPAHREGYAAAKSAYCAGVQGKFWQMHDRLFTTQRTWSGDAGAAARFTGYAQALGVDMAAYRDCVDNDRVAPVILNDVMQASGAGVNGTPTFIVNGTKALGGAIPFDDLKKELDAALANPTPAQPAPPAGAMPPPAGSTPPPVR